nr:hypothetical protein [Salmonella enterica]
MSNSALQKSEDSWYDIVRRSDGCVVFSFPSSGRHLIYRVNGMVSMRPLLDDEEVFEYHGARITTHQAVIWNSDPRNAGDQ